MAVEEFVNKTLSLLDKEREAEIQETQTLSERLSAKELEKRGVCLRRLQLSSHRSGLYGRMVALFVPEAKHRGKNVKQELPSSNITPGDIVGVGLTNSSPTDKPLTSGIVLQMSAFNISVAFDESQDILDLDDSASYKLTKLANDVTYRRLKASLNDLLKYRDGPARRLIDSLFVLEEVSGPFGEFPFKFLNEGLDESQREAVKFALTQREVAIIHGPPGTGKTTTVVEVILQAVSQGLKVLVTAPSNIAVDNLLERLTAAHPSPRLVRLGHPARLMPHLTKFSLDAVVSAAEETDIVRDVRADIQKTLTKMKKARGAGERKSLRDELKHLRKEVSQREERATSEVLSRAQVVLSTLTTASLDGPLKHLKDKTFDLVVIDECSQALEAACWIGLLRGQKCVLAGDHLQLPPTIMSREAANAGLELTLMERLLATLAEEKGQDIVRMLTTQYRMNQLIMAWASQQLYQGKLTAHTSVATHLLRDLEGVSNTEETAAPLLLIDTAGCDLRELDLPEEVSKGNEGEADVVATHVENLIKAGVKPVDIAVIAPYNMQVDLLRDRLCPQHPGLEIKSVDGFQGREKEAVVISMVRSNLTGEVGFLSEKRRINVAVTRARRHLAVVCDSDTVCHDPFIASLVHYMTDHGDVLSADRVLQGQQQCRGLKYS
ncbi:DNA-binding protein smubp-2 [Plakobranchus ocellatus]|uniref:DNA helicase n=1 Tax=Plakobranchus ocellatus TaxID=259542 RepID=A0AAV4CR68_9GAST|nr:DNA-binding protein smubp-2 [Plakobranchus ocellatus]